MLATTIQITNNPPHTPTPKKQNPRPDAQATTVTGGRSHGVEREPDSVLESPPPPNSSRETFYTQPKNAPTPTTPHSGQQTHASTRKQPEHPPQRADTLTVPHKTGLPRKEVIQPHLPVRLPCYDFVPIANPTFDHSPRING